MRYVSSICPYEPSRPGLIPGEPDGAGMAHVVAEHRGTLDLRLVGDGLRSDIASAGSRWKERALFSRMGVTLIASILVTALAAPGAWAHEGVGTAAGHTAE